MKEAIAEDLERKKSGHKYSQKKGQKSSPKGKSSSPTRLEKQGGRQTSQSKGALNEQPKPVPKIENPYQDQAILSVIKEFQPLNEEDNSFEYVPVQEPHLNIRKESSDEENEEGEEGVYRRETAVLEELMNFNLQDMKANKLSLPNAGKSNNSVMKYLKNLQKMLIIESNSENVDVGYKCIPSMLADRSNNIVPEESQTTLSLLKKNKTFSPSTRLSASETKALRSLKNSRRPAHPDLILTSVLESPTV